jgi:hypothetical protein
MSIEKLRERWQSLPKGLRIILSILGIAVPSFLLGYWGNSKSDPEPKKAEDVYQPPGSI